MSVIRQLSYIFLLACLAWVPLGPAQAQYFSAVPDIPFAEGLQ